MMAHHTFFSRLPPIQKHFNRWKATALQFVPKKFLMHGYFNKKKIFNSVQPLWFKNSLQKVTEP